MRRNTVKNEKSKRNFILPDFPRTIPKVISMVKVYAIVCAYTNHSIVNVMGTMLVNNRIPQIIIIKLRSSTDTKLSVLNKCNPLILDRK